MDTPIAPLSLVTSTGHARLTLADRPPRHLGRIVAGSFTFGLGVELLADGAVGIGFSLAALVWLATLLAIGGREAWQQARARAWPIVPYLFFAAMVGVRACPALQAFNVLATIGLGLVLVRVWSGEPVSDGRVTALFSAPLRLVLHAVGHGRRAWLQIAGPRIIRERLGERGRRIVLGAVLALPLLACFAALLSSADALFASLLSGLFRVSPSTLLRAALVVGASTWLAAGLFAQAFRRHTPPAPPPPARVQLGGIEALVILAASDALFLAFAAVQLAGLFASRQALAARGIVWSEYARSGFFQLLAVTLIALGLLMFVGSCLRAMSERELRAVRLLSVAMVGLLLVVVASAFHRMTLYEEAYDFTRLRLFAQTFICAIGALLCHRALTLFWHPERFAIGLLVAAIAWVGALDVLNPDALIARENLRRAVATQKLDPSYLLRLSDDARPELARALPGLNDLDRRELCRALVRAQPVTIDWRGWTLASAAARRAMREVPPCP